MECQHSAQSIIACTCWLARSFHCLFRCSRQSGGQLCIMMYTANASTHKSLLFCVFQACLGSTSSVNPCTFGLSESSVIRGHFEVGPPAADPVVCSRCFPAHLYQNGVRDMGAEADSHKGSFSLPDESTLHPRCPCRLVLGWPSRVHWGEAYGGWSTGC